MKRHGVLVAASTVVGLLLSGGVVVMAGRVGDTARFVTWPVVAFTALASAVAIVGLVAGLHRPWLLVAGVFPALVLSYFLPAAPLPVVAVVLTCLGCLAVTVRDVAAGLAAATGLLMVLFVVLQGPAVTCSHSSVSSGSGPWWIGSQSSSSGSGSSTPGGDAYGITQVGAHQYAYSCVDGRLSRFERVDRP